MIYSVTNTLYSLVIGSGIGLLYGLSFIFQKKRVFSFQTSSTTKSRYITFGFSLLRLAILAILWLYLLRMPVVHIWVVMFSFFVLFWLIILTRK